MISYGRFTRYTPTPLPEGMPPEMAERVAWLQNGEGMDLYALRDYLPEGASYVVVEDDLTVRVVYTDPTKVFAENARLFAYTGPVPDPVFGYIFDEAAGGFVKKPDPVPENVSDRQFATALADMAVITWDEALAWVGPGTIPAALMAVIGALESPAKEQAMMFLSGATTFNRRHALTQQLAAGMGWTDAQLDDLWRAAAAL